MNDQYWENRKAQRMWEHMQSAEETSEILDKIYRKSSRYLSNEIKSIFNRYKTKHNLSEKEARKLIDSLTDPTSFDEMMKELKRGVPTEEKKELLKILEAPAYRYRINRLKKNQNDIDILMKDVYQKEKEVTTNHYINLSSDAYYKSIYDIQKETGFEFSFNGLNAEAVDKVLHSKWSGVNYSSRIWSNTKALANSLKTEFLVSFLSGKTNKEVADIIKNKFDVGSFKARRLVRTESNFIAGELEMQSYEECGIKKYRYVAILDLITSEKCRNLDGKIFSVSERKVGVNMHPMHPWCRSTTIEDFDEEVLKSMSRRARDPVTGKNKIIPGNITYNQWYQNMQKEHGFDTVDILQKKIKNKSSDKKQFSRYKDVLGEEFIPDSFEKFQDMKYNDINKWDDLKRKYRTVNSYEVISGSMNSSQILEFNTRLVNEKSNFTGKMKTGGNISLATFDNKEIIAHSKIQKIDSDNYKKYSGDYKIALLKDKRAFKTKVIGWDRMVDGEAKIFEFINDMNNDSEEKELNVLTSFPMCDSCKDVMKQFKSLNKNVTVNLIQKKVRKRVK